MSKKRPPKPTWKDEHVQQSELFTWIRATRDRCKELKYERHWRALRLTHASLNGVRLTIGQAIKAKKSGMLRGVPDVFMPAPRGAWTGLFIEMKVPGNRPSPEQKEFMALARDEGFFCAVAYTWQDAAEIFIDYLSLPLEVYKEPGESDWSKFKRDEAELKRVMKGRVLTNGRGNKTRTKTTKPALNSD